jgi:hypothetical protein
MGMKKKNITTLAYAQQKYNPQQYIYHKEMNTARYTCRRKK